jgi:hypothetical protein
MLTLEHFVYELVAAGLRALEERPDLADRFRAVLRLDELREPQDDRLVEVAEYAAHAGYCKRTIDNFIQEGMPLVGVGRRRRVWTSPPLARTWTTSPPRRLDDRCLPGGSARAAA